MKTTALRENAMAFACLFLLGFSIGLPLMHAPLYYDEGYFLTIANGVLHGKKVYLDILDNKPPGLYLSLIPAVILAGKSILLMRLIAFSVLVLTAFLVYLIGDRLASKREGFLAGVLYLVVSLNPALTSYALMSEIISSLFLSASIYALLSTSGQKWRYLAAGMLFGISFSVKQSAFLGLLPIALVLWRDSGNRVRMVSYVLLGVAFVWIPLIAYLAVDSSPASFLELTFTKQFSRIAQDDVYTPLSKLSHAVNFIIYVIPTMPFVLFGLWAAFRKHIPLLGWLAAAIACTQIGYGFSHYYIFVIPPLALLAAMGIRRIDDYSKIKSRFFRAATSGAIISLLVLQVLNLFIGIQFHVIAAQVPVSYGMATYYEQQYLAADYINRNVPEDETVLLFSQDFGIYYLTDRFPPLPRSPFLIILAQGPEEFEATFFGPLRDSPPETIIRDSEYVGHVMRSPAAESNTLLLEAFISENYEPRGAIEGTRFQVYRKNQT